MRLSISNISWSEKNDIQMYKLMQKKGYIGLEIAPTRVFLEVPYRKMEEAVVWKKSIFATYGLVVSSMQSIWYGRQEKLFGTEEERKILLEYTKSAINFAGVIECGNLVFGCPMNRCIPEGEDTKNAEQFFKELGEYAALNGTVIGMEANPRIYNTNYINDTSSAIDLIEKVDSKGFRLNLDIGTMIANKEDISIIQGKIHLINHVHISEPYLKPIKERPIHEDLKKLLLDENYQGYISIEMQKVDDFSIIEEKLDYVRSIFA